MTDQTKIEPAFDREDWHAILVGGGTPVTYDASVARGDRREIARSIALANHYLPDSDPRKITREWVRFLNEEASEARARFGESFGPNTAADRLERMADVLASYLPPEG